MTVRALGLAVLSGAAADDCPFSDVSVAQGYVALAYRMGIIKGVSAYNFEPKKEATREQAAAVLLRTYDRLHAAIKVTEAADGSAPSGCVTAGSITEESGSVPVSPRAPMEEVYAAAVRAGEGGSDRGRADRAAVRGHAAHAPLGAARKLVRLPHGEGRLGHGRMVRERDGHRRKDGAVPPAGHRQCLCTEIKKGGRQEAVSLCGFGVTGTSAFRRSQGRGRRRPKR